MTQVRPGAGGAAVLTVMAWVVAAATAAPVPGPPGKAGDKWEYGELRCGFQPANASGEAGGRKVYQPGKATIHWVTRQTAVEAAFEAKYRDVPRLE